MSISGDRWLPLSLRCLTTEQQITKVCNKEFGISCISTHNSFNTYRLDSMSTASINIVLYWVLNLFCFSSYQNAHNQRTYYFPLPSTFKQTNTHTQTLFLCPQVPQSPLRPTVPTSQPHLPKIMFCTFGHTPLQATEHQSLQASVGSKTILIYIHITFQIVHIFFVCLLVLYCKCCYIGYSISTSVIAIDCRDILFSLFIHH